MTADRAGSLARAPIARGPLLALLAATVAIHLAAIGNYGWVRDELYYLSCAKRLAWGYVDQPPFSIALLAAWRALFGASLVGIRLVPLAAGLATVWAAFALARARGGGRFAQALAGTCVIASLIHRAIAHYFSMNAFDLLAWPLVTLALLRALRTRSLRAGLVLGLLVGLGLLTKLSMLWCVAGLLLGVLVTPLRRELARPWFVLACAVAALLFAPHVAWQVAHGWPTLEFMHNATTHKMLATSLAGFVATQLLVLNPLTAPVWLAGLAGGLRGRHGAEGRVLATQYVAVFALLVATGTARAEYLAPAYPALFALGAVAIERMTASPRRAAWRRAAIAAPVVGLAVLLPIALPVLPVQAYVRYQAALRLGPRTEERHHMGVLPQHYADMFGWPELERAVARACATLTPAERSRAAIYVQNYGQAGAIELLGARDRLPPVVCGHNNWWLWGPGRADGSVLVVVGAVRADEIRDFASYTVVTVAGHPLAMPYERDLDVGVGRGLRRPLAEFWPRLKNYN
jgi:hypothetical protein